MVPLKGGTDIVIWWKGPPAGYYLLLKDVLFCCSIDIEDVTGVLPRNTWSAQEPHDCIQGSRDREFEGSLHQVDNVTCLHLT